MRETSDPVESCGAVTNDTFIMNCDGNREAVMMVRCVSLELFCLGFAPFGGFRLIKGSFFSRRRGEGFSHLLPGRLLSPFYSSGHFYVYQVPLIIESSAQRMTISVSQVEGSTSTTVLFPEIHPPVSPGLMRSTPFFLLTSASWVCPKMMTSYFPDAVYRSTGK